MPSHPMHFGAIMSAPWLGAFIWTFIGTCLRTEAQLKGVTLTKLAAMGVEEQSAQVRQLIELGVQALMIKPMGSMGSPLEGALDLAHAARVPVVTLDSVLEHPAVVATVGTNNAAAMAQATRFVIQRMAGIGRLAFFAGDGRLPAGVARNQSFVQTLADYPQVELVHRAQLDWITPMSRREHGAQCMQAALAASPRIDALVCASDEAALGALDHCRSQGLPLPMVMGFDGIPEALLEVSTGGMAGTILQSAELIARAAMGQALAAARGEPVQRLLHVDTMLITTANAEKVALSSLQVVPRLIFDLGEINAARRELEQEIIRKQQKILSAVAAASEALRRIKEPQQMVLQLVRVLTTHFDLTSAHVAQTSAPELASRPYESLLGTQERLLVDDVQTLQTLPVREEAPASGLVRAALLLTLNAGGKTHGFLDLRARHASVFDPGSVEVLTAISRQLAFAIDNALLYEETVRLAASELSETQQKLAITQHAEHLSNHDALTDLPNRRLFNTLLDQALLQAKRYGRQAAVMFLDLDRFKLVNDTSGHEAGDQLLKEAARRLTGCLRESDTVARLGGDEFVILLPELSVLDQVDTVADKVIVAIGRPFSIGGNEFKLTASIGIAMFPRDGADAVSLTKNADIAMYEAKRRGKNNFQYYSEQINARSLQRLALEAGMRRALKQGELRLHYQPKRDAMTERITGMEALLRWQHPELGLVAPGEFLPVAEEMGLSVAIGKWVVDTACRQAVEWQRQGLPALVVSVNLTPKQLLHDGLLDIVDAALADTGLAPECFELEFSEGTLMHDGQRCIRILEALKRRGVRLAVDDFGASYSSLSALKRFPLDTVKIDRSFIRGVATDDADNAVAQAIITMGRDLSLTIVAQGVETRQQAEFLRTHACHECQGFYFNAVLTPEDMAALLRDQMHLPR